MIARRHTCIERNFDCFRHQAYDSIQYVHSSDKTPLHELSDSGEAQEAGGKQMQKKVKSLEQLVIEAESDQEDAKVRHMI